MNFNEIQKRTCRLSCGVKVGTAFLLSPELVITATHSIGSFDTQDDQITLEFRNLSSKSIFVDAAPLTPIKGHVLPVILLKISEPIESITLSPPLIKKWQLFMIRMSKPLF